MKVRIFHQRVSQEHESEAEINEWLDEMGDKIVVRHIKQSSYLTENTVKGGPGLLITIWYDER